MNSIRYHPFGSRVIRAFAIPLYRLSRWLVRQIQAKVKINGGCVLYDGTELLFPSNVGIGFSSSIYLKGTSGFEPHNWRVIKALAKTRNVLVDVGAHFGFYSVLAHKVNSSITTLSFEPIPELHNDCRRFHQANLAHGKFEIYNLALSDKSGQSTIYIPRGVRLTEVRSASLQKEFFYNQQFERDELVIQMTTWDEFVAQRGLNQFKGAETFLKIDVEGHELAVLRGSQTYLRTERPFIVCEIDTAAENVDGLKGLLTPLGYNILAISPSGLFRMDFSDLSSYSGGRDFLLVPGVVRGYYSFQSIEQFAFEN